MNNKAAWTRGPFFRIGSHVVRHIVYAILSVISVVDAVKRLKED